MACTHAPPAKAVAGDAAAESPLDSLPDCLVSALLLPRLSPFDKKILRAACPRVRRLVNGSVRRVCVRANALARCPPGTRLGCAFPAARALTALDWEHAALSDEALIDFLAASGPWLAQLREVDLKAAHHVGRPLLAFLRAACPQLTKLSASRWADSASLAEIARFPALEELSLGDADSDVITVDDLSLGQLKRLSSSLRCLSLARCRWVSDAAFEGLAAALLQLEELDLSHTDVGARGLAWLASLPKLRLLKLEGCRHVTDEALAGLAGMSSLASLSLRGTLATNVGLRNLASLPGLEHLDLGSKWELNDAGLAAVAACRRLRSLAAGSFNLAAPVIPPTGLRSLERLSFGGCFANSPGSLAKLFGLVSLKTLHVQGIDSVTDCVMRHIASQRELRELSLRSGYSLTASGLSALAELSSLAVLSLGACPAISRDSLRAFAARHSRMLSVLDGACPLLADEALCAVAPEPGLALAHYVAVN